MFGDKIKYEYDGAGQDGCTGCSVCMLSCPVWGRTREPSLTFCGRTRALQMGAEAGDVRDSLEACTLCGSCAALCPFGVDTVAETLRMRAALGDGRAPLEENESSAAGPVTHTARKKVLIANPMLLADKAALLKVLSLLGRDTAVSEETGDDLSGALESGRPVSEERLRAFTGPLGKAAEIITTDGLLYRYLRRTAGFSNVLGLGEALIMHARLRMLIGPGDLYIIDSRTYHTDFGRLSGLYDGLRRMTGCGTNLDLQLAATPTGASNRGLKSPVEPVRQAEWILKGRPCRRIVVENIEDVATFKEVTDTPVVFVAELARIGGAGKGGRRGSRGSRRK